MNACPALSSDLATLFLYGAINQLTLSTKVGRCITFLQSKQPSADALADTMQNPLGGDTVFSVCRFLVAFINVFRACMPLMTDRSRNWNQQDLENFLYTNCAKIAPPSVDLMAAANATNGKQILDLAVFCYGKMKQ